MGGMGAVSNPNRWVDMSSAGDRRRVLEQEDEELEQKNNKLIDSLQTKYFFLNALVILLLNGLSWTLALVLRKTVNLLSRNKVQPTTSTVKEV